MKSNLIINSRGKAGKKKATVRPSLPYHAIARRFQENHIIYDREIDVSAIIIK